MATLTTQTITRAGITPSLTAAAGGGDACETSDDIFLEVNNASGGSLTVTLAIPSSSSTYANVAYTNTAVAVAAGTRRFIGPISSIYKDPTTGLATITYSGVTSLTVGAFKVQP